MDVQQLIGEVARRHNVLVDPSDPIFVAVTLSEILLAEHLEKVQAAVAQAERTAELASRRQVESAKLAAAQLMTDGARHAAEQVRTAGSVVRLQLEHLVQDSLASARASARESARSRRASWWAAVVAGMCACTAGGLAAAIWLNGS